MNELRAAFAGKPNSWPRRSLATAINGPPIAWLFASPAAFAPLLQVAKRPDTGAMLAQGIVLITAMIARVPLLLKWTTFRRWFCWTDALSERQRQALALRLVTPWQNISSQSTKATQMRTSSIEALASARACIAEEAILPTGYEGTATPEAHRASETVQAQIRAHIVATNDMRLFGLLHLRASAVHQGQQVHRARLLPQRIPIRDRPSGVRYHRPRSDRD